ncbi:hypothetical protein OAA91_01445 [Fibrobacterales bacterium]|nr:hypothetical protein [Fibrobacterales bacterium]
MFETESVTRLFIFIAVGIIGYNIFRIFLTQEKLEAEINEFKDLISSEGLEKKRLLNGYLLTQALLGASQLGLLFLSEFSLFFLGLFTTHFVIFGWYGINLQNKIADGEDFSSQNFMWLKVDSGLLVLLMSSALISLFIA